MAADTTSNGVNQVWVWIVGALFTLLTLFANISMIATHSDIAAIRADVSSGKAAIERVEADVKHDEKDGDRDYSAIQGLTVRVDNLETNVSGLMRSQNQKQRMQINLLTHSLDLARTEVAITQPEKIDVHAIADTTPYPVDPDDMKPNPVIAFFENLKSSLGLK